MSKAARAWLAALIPLAIIVGVAATIRYAVIAANRFPTECIDVIRDPAIDQLESEAALLHAAQVACSQSTLADSSFQPVADDRGPEGFTYFVGNASDTERFTAVYESNGRSLRVAITRRSEAFEVCLTAYWR